MTFSRLLDNLRWNFMEAGLMHVHSTLRQFADSLQGANVTISAGRTFGALELTGTGDLATPVVSTVNDPGQYNLGVGSTNPPVDKAPPTNFRT